MFSESLLPSPTRNISSYIPVTSSSILAAMSSPSKRSLFFPADSDSEDEVVPASASDALSRREALFIPDEEPNEEDDVVVVGGSAPSSRSSPGPSSSRQPSSSRLPSNSKLPSSTKQPSSPPPSSAGPSSAGPSSAGPSRPKRLAGQSEGERPTVRPGFTRGYLGEFVCEGWSLSKGKGYCSPGSKVVFARPKTKNVDKTVGPDSSAMLGPARLVNGKVVHAKSKIGGKQMTLGAMMKKAPAPVSMGDDGADGRRRRRQPRRSTKSSGSATSEALVGQMR